MRLSFRMRATVYRPVDACNTKNLAPNTFHTFNSRLFVVMHLHYLLFNLRVAFHRKMELLLRNRWLSKRKVTHALRCG